MTFYTQFCNMNFNSKVSISLHIGFYIFIIILAEGFLKSYINMCLECHSIKATLSFLKCLHNPINTIRFILHHSFISYNRMITIKEFNLWISLFSNPKCLTNIIIYQPSPGIDQHWSIHCYCFTHYIPGIWI